MEREATAALAQFAATLTYDDIPERTREACKGLLLDALACALAGQSAVVAELERKFRTSARARLPDARIEEALDLVSGLPALPPTRTDLLRSERGA